MVDMGGFSLPPEQQEVMSGSGGISPFGCF